MSLVLYRKYRPQKLTDVVGQEPIIATLKAALNKQTLAHALLFTGLKGVGKTSLARILAHEINQIPYDLNQTPLDIIEIDAASNRRIDEIRDLREKIKLMPLKLTYKVYIIDEIHMLTKEAFNALLKTLEEPPQHIVFILATTEIHKVPPTIVSRCQHFTFKAITQPVLIKHLQTIAKKEKIVIDKAALTLLAQRSQGSLRDGLSLLDQLASLDEKITVDLVEKILGLPPATVTNKLLTALKDNDFKQVIDNYQDLTTRGVDPIILTRQLSQIIRQDLYQNQKESFPQAIDLLEDLLDVFRAPNPQATLEVTLLKHAQDQQKTFL